jgi:hypothetical protein
MMEKIVFQRKKHVRVDPNIPFTPSQGVMFIFQ